MQSVWRMARGIYGPRRRARAVNVVVLEGCNSASPQQQCGGREVRQGTSLSSGGTLKLERSGETQLSSLRHLGGSAQGPVQGHTKQCLPSWCWARGRAQQIDTESLTLTWLHAAWGSRAHPFPAGAALCPGVTRKRLQCWQAHGKGEGLLCLCLSSFM